MIYNFFILSLDIVLALFVLLCIACLYNGDMKLGSYMLVGVGLAFVFLAIDVADFNEQSIENPIKQSYVEEKTYVLQCNDTYKESTNETLASSGIASMNMNSGNINLYITKDDGSIKTQIIPLSKTKIYKADGNQVTLTIKHKRITYKKYSMIIGYTHNVKKDYKKDKKYILVMPENMIKAIQ